MDDLFPDIEPLFNLKSCFIVFAKIGILYYASLFTILIILGLFGRQTNKKKLVLIPAILLAGGYGVACLFAYIPCQVIGVSMIVFVKIGILYYASVFTILIILGLFGWQTNKKKLVLIPAILLAGGYGVACLFAYIPCQVIGVSMIVGGIAFICSGIGICKDPMPGVVIVAMGLSFLTIPSPIFDKHVVGAQYSAEPIPLVGHIRTQVDLYQYEHGRLPFDDAEAGTVATWRKTDDGRYEPIQFALGGSETNVLSKTGNVFSRLDMSASEVSGKKLTPDQVYMACLAPGGSTNAYAYAIGVLGGGNPGLMRGTGYAVLEAFFPDVIVSDGAGYYSGEGESRADKGYKLVATWTDYERGETPIRFGCAGESGASDEAVCPLVPPEAFAPGAVTKLHGDGPDSVEYWVERLRDAPCGRWEYSLP